MYGAFFANTAVTFSEERLKTGFSHESGHRDLTKHTFFTHNYDKNVHKWGDYCILYKKNHYIKQKCVLPLFNTYLCNSYLPDANYNRWLRRFRMILLERYRKSVLFQFLLEVILQIFCSDCCGNANLYCCIAVWDTRPQFTYKDAVDKIDSSGYYISGGWSAAVLSRKLSTNWKTWWSEGRCNEHVFTLCTQRRVHRKKTKPPGESRADLSLKYRQNKCVQMLKIQEHSLTGDARSDPLMHRAGFRARSLKSAFISIVIRVRIWRCLNTSLM